MASKILLCNQIFLLFDLDIIDRKGAKGAPDLVIEILSPSNAEKDQVLKLAKYEKHGVKEIWMIAPIKKVVFVYILNQFKRYDKPIIYQNSNDTVKAAVLPDFKISFQHIFARENVVNSELFEEGASEKAKNIAKNLLAMGLTPVEVTRGTGLDLDVVLKLRSKVYDTI